MTGESKRERERRGEEGEAEKKEGRRGRRRRERGRRVKCSPVPERSGAEEDRRCAWIHLSGQRSAVCEQLASPLQSLLVLLRAKVTEGAKRWGGKQKETEIKRRKTERKR